MCRFVGGEGVGDIGAESIFIGLGGVSVQAAGDVQCDFNSCRTVGQPAGGSNFGGNAAGKTGTENAVDNDVVNVFRQALCTAKPDSGQTL